MMHTLCLDYGRPTPVMPFRTSLTFTKKSHLGLLDQVSILTMRSRDHT